MKKRILLADRDESVRKMVGRVLESEDYNVLLAGSGWEAVNKALANSPDLVLFDADMPDSDGSQSFELIHRIQPLVRVIGMSARHSLPERARPVEMDAFMEKPLDLGVLLDTIRCLLDESDQERVKRPDRGTPSSPCEPHAVHGQSGVRD
jgi:DNA-binding response OmpR family regulator